MNGQLQLDSQSESTTTKQPDGTEVTQTNVFAKTVAGNVQDSSGALRVKEQHLVQRRTNPDGSVVETLSVRRPSVSDPNRLGDLAESFGNGVQGQVPGGCPTHLRCTESGRYEG